MSKWSPPDTAQWIRVPVFDRADTSDADLGSLFAQVTATDVDEFDRTGLPGVQVKVSAQMISTPLSTSRGPAILKLNPPDHPFLVQRELLPRHGGSVRHPSSASPPCHRCLGSNWAVRRPVRSGCRRRWCTEAGAGGRMSGRRSVSGGKISSHVPRAMKSLAEAVAAGGGSYPLAIVRMLEIAAFSYLIGNGDLHGKNLSIRQNPTGLWEVTPAYDLLTTQPYLSWNDPMALTLYGRDGKLIYRWWIEAATTWGCPSAQSGAVWHVSSIRRSSGSTGSRTSVSTKRRRAVWVG